MILGAAVVVVAIFMGMNCDDIVVIVVFVGMGYDIVSMVQEGVKKMDCGGDGGGGCGTIRCGDGI